MSYCECPYCKHDCGDYFDDCHAQDVEYEHQCPECEKNFIFTITYYPSFSSFKADCLNGGECDLKPICGVPKEYFENKFQCKDCGKKVTKDFRNSGECEQ